MVTISSLMILDRRKRGRPRADEPRSTVSTWLPASDHDLIVKMANQREMSISEFVGDVLRREIRTRAIIPTRKIADQ